MRGEWKLPDFDTLMAFHQKNPRAYERFRRKILNHAIASAPEKSRPALRRTLQKIESARQTANSPLEAAIAAHLLMCESITELNYAMHQLQFLNAEMQTTLLVGKLKKNSEVKQVKPAIDMKRG